MPESVAPATYVSDLRPNRVATLELKVVQVEPVREVVGAAGLTKKVQNVRLKDGTGDITLVLWGSEVNQLREGQEIRIVEGWVKDYKGRLQISLGRTGSIRHLSG